MSTIVQVRRKARRTLRYLPGSTFLRQRLSRLINYRRLPPLEPLPESVRDLLDGSLATGSRDSVVFLVSDTTILPVGRQLRRWRHRRRLSRRQQSAAIELRAACGLAAALSERSHGVRIKAFDPVKSPLPLGTTAIVVLNPRYDPSAIPGTAPCLAWAVDDPDLWVEHPRLALFDRVLAASGLLQQRLSLRTDQPLSLLPLAATDLTTPDARRTKAVAVHSRAAAAGGIVPDGVFRAVSQGKIPVISSRLGLDELDLDLVPTYRSTTERSQHLSWFRRQQPEARLLFDQLQDRIRQNHTYDHRSRTFAELLPEVLPRTRAPGAEQTRVLGLFPDYRATNPYQDMLYRELDADGVEIVPLRDVTTCSIPRDGGGPLDRYLLHIHWTSAILHVAEDPKHARERLDAFRSQVLDLKNRGGHLVWTVHNVLPHELDYLDLEMELCQFLADHADLVHVMSKQTLEATSPYFRLDPSRLVVIPHSSYLGIYPDMVDRAKAREWLGLAEDEVALLTVGGIRAYRGLDRLLDVFEELSAWDPRLRLLIAGKPGHTPEVISVKERCTAHPAIIEKFHHLPTGELQVWHRAADLAVLPYRAILNSGAFKLAQTFGLPVVAPRSGSLAEALDSASSIGFSPEDDGSLVEAVCEGITKVTTPEWARKAHESALSLAQAYSPSHMASDFAEAIRPLFGDRPSTASPNHSGPGEAEPTFHIDTAISSDRIL